MGFGTGLVILSLVGLYSACTNDRQGLFLYYTGLMLMCGLLLYIGVYCLLFAENARSFELLYYKTRAPAELPNSKQAIEERAMAAVGSANPYPPCSTPSDEVVLALCAFIQWTRSQPSSPHSQVFGIFITAPRKHPLQSQESMLQPLVAFHRLFHHRPSMFSSFVMLERGPCVSNSAQETRIIPLFDSRRAGFM